MKRLFRALFHPVVLGIVGLLALSLLIWFVGPLIAIASHAPLDSTTARWVLIFLLFAAVAARLIYTRWKSKAANAKFFSSLLGKAYAAAESDEVRTLRTRLEQAVALLRKSQLAQERDVLSRLLGLGQSRHLYQMPWYMFIGAPGSGKTTALVNSGLRFPVAEQLGSHQVKGVGGTRNCDWWFTDEAVLLDTAGRYTTQDSDLEADRTAWQGFLALLRKHRPRQPLNGVIMTISVSDLLSQSEDESARHAEALRARLQELYERLGVRLPVYVLVTKADLMAGFDEYFSALGQDGRDQVWGCTLPLDQPPAEIADALGSRLAALLQRLQDQLILRLQQESDLIRRGAIAGFDQQFAALTLKLQALLARVFAPSGYDHPLLVRGVYFTSGTQQGNPIDRLMSTLGGAFGLERSLLPPQPGRGKSYFLTRLMREVVFAEQRIGGTNLKWERQRDLLRAATLAGIAIASLGLIVGWTYSSIGNARYVEQVQSNVDKAQPLVARAGQARDIAEMLRVLETVAEVAATPTRSRGEQSAGMGLGLFQGEKLDAASQQANRTLVRDLLLPQIARRLEVQLRSLDGSDPEFAYEALKSYLMLHQPANLDAAALKAWILLDWERNATGLDAKQLSLLSRQLDELFASGPLNTALRLDDALVKRTRDMLQRSSLAQRIYSRLRREGTGSNLPGFSIPREVGPGGAAVLTRRSGKPLTEEHPALFTRDGYQQGFERQLDRVTQQLRKEEPWVLGNATTDASAASVSSEVRKLYLMDYARHWETLLADITIAPSANLTQSVQIARVLSGSDSPLPKLLTAVARETQLAPSEGKSVAEQAGDKLDSARQQLGKLFDSEPVRAAAPAERIERTLVDERFSAIHRLVAGDAKSAPIAAVLQLLDGVYVQLSMTETALRDKVEPPAGDSGAKLKAEAARLPEPLKSILQQLSGAAAGQSQAAARQNLAAAVGSQVGQFCLTAIEGRYPFTRNSNRDVAREDFARLFASGGLIDDFFQKNLAPIVDTTKRPWSFKRVQDQASGASSSLAQFQRAAAIRDVFFRSNNLKFEIKLVEADQTLVPLTLEIDGQAIQFSPGGRPQMVQWPGSAGGLSAQLRPASGSTIQAEGYWALWRLIDRARTDAMGAPEKMRATFDLDGRRASFEITASSVQNPLRLREIAEFRCPQGL